MHTETLLKQYFGHSQFRPGQEALVRALTTGQDVLGVMPTGAGKSICYQLPALLHKGLTIVVSPLISLMKDQVEALGESGISAAYINSSLSFAQCNEVFSRGRKGRYKIIYVAPERLDTEAFLSFSKEIEISLLAIDEAHCVSQWGQDFRPSYLNIADFVDTLPKRPVIGAFTATATEVVKDDIEKLLRLQHPLSMTTGFDRPNLSFSVMHPKSKQAYLGAYLTGRGNQSGIIYCATRKLVESVCEDLQEKGISATRYHAGLSNEERQKNQEDFVFDRSRVMVATNAFGMGIDKSNVSFVVHYNMPKNIESYYQEAGRAGRDGEKADCVLLFSAGDVQTAKFLIGQSQENEALSQEEREQVYARDLKRLEQITTFCKTTTCLRAYLLDYFGETAPKHCGNCSSCNSEMTQEDITIEAQKILSAVARVEKKYNSGLGVLLVVRMLHGSKDQRVLQLSLDQLPTYGILKELSRPQIRDYIDFLVQEGYLMLTGGEYPVLRLTEDAKKVLFQEERVLFTSRKRSVAEGTGSVRKGAKALPTQMEEGLLTALKALRTTLAQKENLPAYIVFSNAALTDMAVKQPTTMADFLEVSGVGAVKAEKYGTVFLEEIRRFQGAEK